MSTSKEFFDPEKGQLYVVHDTLLFVFKDCELTPPVLAKLPKDSSVILLHFVPFHYVWKVLTPIGVAYVSVSELRNNASHL